MTDVTYCPPNVTCPVYVRMSAEIERLRDENDQHRIDLEEYRLDVERLRAALQAVMNDLEIVVECGGLNDGFLNDIVYTNARAALEGKHD